MRNVSCRKDFENRDAWSDNLNVSYNGGSSFRAIDARDVFVAQRDYRELVMVHGYNTEARNVYDAYRSNTIMASEEGLLQQVTGFLWPGLGSTWIESLLFHKAQKYADASAPHFAKYISDYAGKKLTVMTHSLGARVALQAIRQFKVHVDVLALTGPAVDWNCFEPGKGYDECLPFIGKVLVFYSNNDPVLGHLYRDDQFMEALGCKGLKTPIAGITTVDMSATVKAHGDYRYDRSMWRTIRDASA